MKKTIIKAWAVCAKTKNGKTILQQDFVDECNMDDSDKNYYVYIICEGINTAKRYNRLELDKEWEVKEVEIKI